MYGDLRADSGVFAYCNLFLAQSLHFLQYPLAQSKAAGYIIGEIGVSRLVLVVLSWRLKAKAMRSAEMSDLNKIFSAAGVQGGADAIDFSHQVRSPASCPQARPVTSTICSLP